MAQTRLLRSTEVAQVLRAANVGGSYTVDAWAAILETEQYDECCSSLWVVAQEALSIVDKQIDDEAAKAGKFVYSFPYPLQPTVRQWAADFGWGRSWMTLSRLPGCVGAMWMVTAYAPEEDHSRLQALRAWV